MFVLPVIAYVMKDRIKEMTKDWMIRRMRAYDQDTELIGSQLARSGLGSLRGTLREKVSFLDQAPDDVLALRQRSEWIAGARIGGESVLVYRRKLEILAPEDQPRSTDELALRQIIRLNLRHFMTRLDERDQIVHHYDPSIGGFATREIAKVYHLNVVVRIGGPNPGAHLERWRVVFSRDGIERIERGEMGMRIERSEMGGGDPAGSAGGAGGKAPRGIDSGATVGVLVQTNFGGTLTIAGAAIGRALGTGITSAPPGGSIMIVVATDAPVDHRQLERLARRALIGLGRAGSFLEHGSGDFVIAFTTSHLPPLADDGLNPLFQAVADATEEAIVNSLLRAQTVRGARGTAEALPLDRVRRLLEDHRVLPAR